MKTRLAALLLSTLAATALWARPVSDDEARLAVSRWLLKTPCPAEAAKLAGTAEGVHSVSNETGTALFHVVRVSGGGYVVTSSETKIAPVIAFSDAGDFPVSPGNPLYEILTADMERRLEQVAPPAAPARRSLSAAILPNTGSNATDGVLDETPTKEESEWAALLGEAGTPPRQALSSTSDKNEPFDVRVAPLLETKWGQDGAAAFYTPNHYPCGCVALAGAQIARYWRHPTASMPQVTRLCSVVSASGAVIDANYTTKGGRYNWDAMPGIIASDDASFSLTDTQKESVGKLCYDFGVSVGTSWGSGGSSAFSFLLDGALTGVFGFANSRVWIGEPNSVAPAGTIERTILASLDAKCPVGLGIDRHMVVADGYGFSDTTLFTHLNIGWGGRYDTWYNLPSVELWYSSTVLDEIIYNIFPTQTGDLFTGRVVDRYGTPITNVAVVATDGSTQNTAGATASFQTTTDAHGIFAFCVNGGKTWTVSATFVDADGTVATASKDVAVGKSVSTRYEGSSIWPGTETLGNSWGNDIALNVSITSVPDAPTDVAASQGEIYGEVRVSWSASEGATSYFVYRAPPGATAAACIGTTSGTHFYDTAAEVGTAYTYWVVAASAAGRSPWSDPASGWSADTPPVVNGNDNFADAYALSGANGSTTGTTAGMTREVGEPPHTTTAGSTWNWWEEVGSAWWKWTAPEDTTVVFDTAGSAFDTILAIYTGNTVTTLSEVDSNDDVTAEIRTSLCEFNAVAGTTYFIAVTGYYYETGPEVGAVVLNWRTPTRPGNDDFRNAAALSGSSGSTVGSNILSTRENGEPEHAGYSSTGSVWWRWTAPKEGTAVFDTEGSTFDTVLAVYSGSTLPALATVASDDDGGSGTASRCSFAVAAGTVYQIAVSGVGKTGDIKLNWKFTEKTYTATFNANGGRGGTTRALVRGAALSAPTVSRVGYVFAGWSPAVPATMPAANVTYVAKWTPIIYKIAFNANGGLGKMATRTFTYGEAKNLPDAAFSRNGWLFAGWSASNSGAPVYSNTQAVKNLSAKNGDTVTLYAVWAKKTYKVAFYANGGKGKMAVETFTYGKAKKLAANNFKAPKGKKFAGWAKSKALAKKGTVAYKNKQKVKNLLRNGKTVKLYAVWKKK